MRRANKGPSDCGVDFAQTSSSTTTCRDDGVAERLRDDSLREWARILVELAYRKVRGVKC